MHSALQCVRLERVGETCNGPLSKCFLSKSLLRKIKPHTGKHTPRGRTGLFFYCISDKTKQIAVVIHVWLIWMCCSWGRSTSLRALLEVSGLKTANWQSVCKLILHLILRSPVGLVHWSWACLMWSRSSSSLMCIQSPVHKGLPCSLPQIGQHSPVCRLGISHTEYLQTHWSP